MQEGGAMFPEAVDELTGQRGGELEELVGVEERSLGGVQTNRDSGVLEVQHVDGNLCVWCLAQVRLTAQHLWISSSQWDQKAL